MEAAHAEATKSVTGTCAVSHKALSHAIMVAMLDEEDFGHLWRTNGRSRRHYDLEAHHDNGTISSLEPFVALCTPGKCRVSSDTRGHLGPVQVILRGDDNDWMSDRRRHAVHNNQRGAAARWYQVDWDESVWIAGCVALDWETALAETYELQVRWSPDQEWSTVFVAARSHPGPTANMSTRYWGKNPVFDAPLHHLHKIHVPLSGPAQSLRVFVHEQQKGGFFSLWRIHVFGYECNSVPSMFRTRPTLLTEDPDFVSVTANDTGEYGAHVENVLSAGTNYFSDRWCVCPTNMYGSLWVQLRFDRNVIMTKIVLDWSGQHASRYDLQVGSPDHWFTIRRSPDEDNIHVERYGKLPYVRDEMFLHHVDHIQMPMTNQPTRFVRLLIHEPATDLGVSLWQIKVYGYKM
jgi:hypothetical protein